MIHAERGIVIRPGLFVEHGVGRVRAGDGPAFRRERGDRRLDDLDLLPAERPAFAGMGVESGHGEPRPGDPEIALEAAKRCAPARFDESRGQISRNLRDPQVRRHGDRSKRRSGEHHHDIAGGNSAALGDEFGLTRVLEADRIELLLGDRPGDDGDRGPRPGEPDRELERIERTMGAGHARMAGQVRLGGGELNERQSDIERGIRLAGVGDGLDRPIPDRRDGPRIADGDERRQVERRAVVPAFGDDFGTDSGRITKGDCKRRFRKARHERAPYRISAISEIQ